MHSADQAVPYDLTQPPLLLPPELQALRSAAIEVSRALAAVLSDFLFGPVQCAVVDAGETGDWFGATGEDCPWVWCEPAVTDRADLPAWGFHRGLARALTSRMLTGGAGEYDSPSGELSLVEGALLGHLCTQMQDAWAAVWPLAAPDVRRWSVVPAQAPPAVAAGARAIHLTFRLVIASHQGCCALVLPPALARLCRGRNQGPARASTCRPNPALDGATLSASVYLGTWRTTLRQLMRLQPGQVVPLHVRPQDELTLAIAGLEKMTVRAGTHNGRIAVQVVGLGPRSNTRPPVDEPPHSPP